MFLSFNCFSNYYFYFYLSEHVNVLNVSVFFQSDGNMAASVRVGSPQEAQVGFLLELFLSNIVSVLGFKTPIFYDYSHLKIATFFSLRVKNYSFGFSYRR